MKRVRFSMFVFMLIVLLAAGLLGFKSSENLTTLDSFHTTIAALTFSGNTAEFSEQGKLLNTVLAIASVAVIVWAFVNFHTSEITDNVKDYFKFIPQDEGLILKEIKIASKSHLAGLKKIDVLQRTGTVVFGIKKGAAFQLSVPFNKRLSANTRALFLGTPMQLKEVEREAKR